MRTVAILILLLMIPGAFGQQAAQNELKRMSLEELLDMNVTSVARTPDPLSRTAAAVTVITNEDIRRSGATSVPELFRLVPGLDVARFAAGSWAVSSRGFNSTAADKLLVLIDGRTVYSPLFSGTFWEVQDLVLEDVERIEVVRGPGATLWGANAVNGIINIITKTAHQTQGVLATITGGGAEDLAELSARYGNKRGSDLSYRIDTKYFYRDQFKLSNGADAKDATRMGRFGFRIDDSQPATDLTLQGDAYNGLEGFLGREDSKLFGGNILARAVHRFSQRSEVRVQSYFQRDYRRVNLQSEFFQNIFDIDFQHHYVATERHRLTWGAEYRWNKDSTRPTNVLSFNPAVRTYPLVTAFVQDEIPLAKDKIQLTVGTKVEHNDFSGVEAQPSVRASFLLLPEHAVWAAVSRAVRTPTRFDTDIRFGSPGLAIVGNPDFEAEQLLAYEIGYRGRPARKFSLDTALYANRYSSLRSLELQPGRILEMNHLNARTYGGEISLTYDAASWLRVRGNYALLSKALEMDSGHIDVFGGTLEGNDPRHQFSFQALSDIGKHFEWDVTGRFVDRLSAPPVPRYFEMDTRFEWSPKPAVQFSIIGRNLLQPRHPEFGPPVPPRTEVERNVYGRITVEF